VLTVASLLASIVVVAPWPNGGTIPKRYTCDGADATPTIRLTGYVVGDSVREATALELVDVDAPGGHFVHWLLLGSVAGRNTFGMVGWSGPCPPPGDSAHRYVLHAYLLDRVVRLRAGFGEQQFRRALRGHVLASAKLVGLYKRT
jgi:phosphatidylethanolamine-binding protein (PEBP) family uncharacterized protein